MGPDLDPWLPDPQVRTRHRQSAEVDADRLWDAAQTIRLRDAPRLGRAVRWRIPGTSSELSFRDLFRQYPFAVIAEGSRWSVSGMCGRIWTLRRDYPRIEGAQDFTAWQEPGTVRVLLAHWIEGDGRGQSSLVSETRIKPVDSQAGVRLRAMWVLVGHFERLIGGEVLRNAARSAE
ncbi:MAG: hypothetical protein WB771_02120 [Solirubrobacterales bacterium]